MGQKTQPHGTQPRLAPTQPSCSRPLPSRVLALAPWGRVPGQPQSPTAQREKKPEQKGPALSSRSLPWHWRVPHRSHFQSGRAASSTGLKGKETACSNTPQPRNCRFPAWHSTAPSPAAQSPACPDGDGAAGTGAAGDTPGPRPIPRCPSRGAEGKTPSHYNSSR